MARSYGQAIEDVLVPPAWDAGKACGEQKDSWLKWRSESIATVNDTLWPSWDEQRSAWVKSDAAAMKRLTMADFELFRRILVEDKVIESRPVPPNPSPDLPTHHDFYLEEDGARPFGSGYARYDSTLPKEIADEVPGQIKTALKAKVGSSGLQFKAVLQRPRAYQAAVLLGIDFFGHQLAFTSMTPSMSSGHSQQGCLAGAAVYERWLSNGVHPSEHQVLALQQFSVDVGDRRVFAGVHYPSDNLASWWFSLGMAEHVFERPETRRFLWEAITRRSRVWRYLSEVSSDANSPFLPMLEVIRRLEPA